MHAGASSSRSYGVLRQYYPGNSGVALAVESPFEFGILGISIDAITMHGTSSAQVPTSTKAISLDWQRRVGLTKRIDLRPGVRIGDYHMVFQDPRFSEPGASPDHGTEEFLIGPRLAADVLLSSNLLVTLNGSWTYMPSAPPMKITFVNLVAGYSMAMPRWLRQFIQ